MIKLYDSDSYIKEFSAKVVSCTEYKGGFIIMLDQTAFFPTAGGQEHDGGLLDGQELLDVITENDEILHKVKNPIEIGKTVIGKIAWQERLRKMRHHSGEHIVSGIAHRLYGVNNVGFHLGDKEVTIDYDRELTRDEIRRLEVLSNDAVMKNIPIICGYPDKETLKSTDYRSKLDLEDNVRLVTIPDVDICACCAPHVRATGEIGIIKITDAMRHRGGIRLRMVCGEDALSDYEKKQDNIETVSKLLSWKQEEVGKGVEKLLEENSSLKIELASLKREIAGYMSKEIPETTGNYCFFAETTDKNAMRSIAANSVDRIGGILVVLSGSDETGYSYIMASKMVNLKNEIKNINQSLNGKGGGKEDTAEGRFSVGKKEIEAYFLSGKIKI